MSVLQVAAIPNEAIPIDAVERHLLPFLDARHVGLYGLATDNFGEMHQMFDSIPVVPEDDGAAELEQLLAIHVGGAEANSEGNNNPEPVSAIDLNNGSDIIVEQIHPDGFNRRETEPDCDGCDDG